jgi:hypothetical protein
MKTSVLFAVVAQVAFAAGPRPAPAAAPAAAPVAAPAPERPWAAGVAPAQQEEALRIFTAGNELFEQSNHAQALTRYREALKAWDHPAIRFNAAVALINLDQPLQAFENLEAALRFGEAPFNAETWRQGLLYKKLLSGQLSELEVVCDEPGAEVTLDGERLFTAPGTATRRVRPGAHQLVASKAGFATTVVPVELAAGGQRREALTVAVAVAPPVRLVRRFPTYLPWTVMGAGALVALLGVPVFASAQSNYTAWDSDLARLCPTGCALSSLPASVSERRVAGQNENVAAVVLFGVGAAAVVSGVVLMALNTPRPEEEAAPQVSLVPLVGPGLAGVFGRVTF